MASVFCALDNTDAQGPEVFLFRVKARNLLLWEVFPDSQKWDMLECGNIITSQKLQTVFDAY
jgi:hypothetical protein